MRKKKFLELLNKKIVDCDDIHKQKLLDKYNQKITVKMRKLSEKDAVSLFDLDKIVKKELFILKVKLFFKRLFNGIFSFFKLIFLKIKNFCEILFKKLRFKKNKKEVRSKKIINGELNYDNKKVICNNHFLMCVLSILYFLMFIVLFLLGILFFINVIAILDGVRLFSFILATVFVILFVIMILLILNCILKGKNVDFKSFLVYPIILLFLLGCSVGYVFYDIYKLEEIDDLSELYTMSNESNVFDLLDDDVLDIEFNSNYDNRYFIKYDESLDNQVKIVVNYYRNYYDCLIKKSRNDIYISFHDNKRNIVSTFIEGLRENKILNFDELKRYNITIYVNENDKNKINVY